jgi:ATP-dependent DNA helicase DinG
MPPKFKTWRPGQEQVISDFIDSNERFIGMSAPTGSGKSLTAMSIAKYSGSRTLYLTSTKSLQSQLLNDFYTMGLRDVRGQNSYACVAAPDFGYPADELITVDHGPCHYGDNCSLKTQGGCFYYDAIKDARDSEFVVTNYSFWMTLADIEGYPLYPKIEESSEGEDQYRKFDLLIMDEAHASFNHLSSHLTVEFDEFECDNFLRGRLPDHLRVRAWSEWAASKLETAERAYLEMKNKVRGDKKLFKMYRVELGILKNLIARLKFVAALQGDWIIERWDTKVIISPVWPAGYAESVLFRGIEKVLLLSATIRPKTLEMLGIGKGDGRFYDYPSTFDPKRRPVYFIPAVRMRHGMTEDETKFFIAKVEQVISSRRDRKGIIHTVSYDRAKMLKRTSRLSHLMLTHTAQTARSVIERFRRTEPPAVLVSPSVTTGLDFPYDEAEYSIISKVPFTDNRSAILQARMKSDPEFAFYIAIQEVVQASGRGMRAEDDAFETFCFDTSFGWMLRSYKHLFPAWFLEAVQQVDYIPAAPPKL